MTKQRVFFTMVKHFPRGWIRAGNAYGSRKAAREWLGFVRASHGGAAGRIAQCTLTLDEQGKPDERSTKVLSEKFNLEVAP